MQCIPKDRILEYNPDTMIAIRKEYNLDKPGMMKEAITILREWVQKQAHFKKKDFPDAYLERAIISCKGSLERTKKMLDRMCTLRTLLPHFFELRNPKTGFGDLFDQICPVLLPKMTPEHYRVFMFKSNDKTHLLRDHLVYFIFAIIMGDYLKLHDYCRGFIAIIDFTELNIIEFLSHLNPMLIRQVLTILIEGYGLRLKGVYIYTPSRLIDTFITIIKQVVSAKIASRIHSYTTLDNVTDIVPVDILPQEYGGKERPIKVLLDDWLEVLSSEENLSYLKDLSQAGTDESCRQTDIFNDQYAGMAGTFRTLTVD